MSGRGSLLIACNVEGTPVAVSPGSVLDGFGLGDERPGATNWTVALAGPDAAAEIGEDADPIRVETADAVV